MTKAEKFLEEVGKTIGEEIADAYIELYNGGKPFSDSDYKHFSERWNKWVDGLKKGELGYLSLNKTNYGGKVTRCLLKVLGIKPPKTLGELVPLILAQPKLFAHDSTKM